VRYTRSLQRLFVYNPNSISVVQIKSICLLSNFLRVYITFCLCLLSYSNII